MRTTRSTRPSGQALETTRDRILEAARDEFAVRGKAGARMDRIAAKASANKAMLYYYYSSKDNLYREVLRSTFEEVFTGLDRVVRTESPLEDKVHSLVSFYVDFYAQHSAFIRIMMREMADGAADILAVLSESSTGTPNPNPRTILESLRGEIQALHLKHIDTRHLTLSLVGMCLFMFMARPIVPVVIGLDPDNPETIRQRKQQVAELLLYGISGNARDKR